jgi:benzil reductase ((S)-benzoin forming)
MAAHLYILTGASRGMGLAVATQLLQKGNHLLCLSRHTNALLQDEADKQKIPLVQWQQDLSDSVAAGQHLSQWLEEQSSAGFSSATLINNAGMIAKISPLSQADPTDLAMALRVGLEAPMQLASAFLKSTERWNIPLKILNISSGLGRRAMASQAAYCAAKAGMDHFTRCLSLDEALKPNGAKVCSLAPGVIDTDMQVQLRAAKEQNFPDRAGFLSLKATGALTAPAEAAARILAFLHRPDFGTQPVADIRD